LIFSIILLSFPQNKSVSNALRNSIPPSFTYCFFIHFEKFALNKALNKNFSVSQRGLPDMPILAQQTFRFQLSSIDRFRQIIKSGTNF